MRTLCRVGVELIKCFIQDNYSKERTLDSLWRQEEHESEGEAVTHSDKRGARKSILPRLTQWRM
eukprot:1160598-Pelagomonas_calceolata.AAC.5